MDEILPAGPISVRRASLRHQSGLADASYRALAFALVRLFLTEYASLPWTHQHAGLYRRTLANASIELVPGLGVPRFRETWQEELPKSSGFRGVKEFYILYATKKKLQIARRDFVNAADALTNESFNGGVHLAIAEGLANMDPFVGKHAPVFSCRRFMGTCTLLKCTQTSFSIAVTDEEFLEMARMKKSKFQCAEEQDVLECIAEAQSTIKSLEPAHLSPKLTFTPEVMQAAAS